MAIDEQKKWGLKEEEEEEMWEKDYCLTICMVFNFLGSFVKFKQIVTYMQMHANCVSIA